MWQKASELLLNQLKTTLKEKKKCLLLLSGGSAVNICYSLAEYIKKAQIGSDILAIGQVDERFIPKNHESGIKNQESARDLINSPINAVNIRNSGLIDILKEKNIPFYKIPQEGMLQEAADFYNRQLEELFKKYTFRMAVLGIGRDGHTAGFLPGYKKMWDKERFAAGYENLGQFPRRITVTPLVIRKLDYALVAVSGNEKKEVLQKILNKGSDDINRLPGLLVHEIKEADLVTDCL